jgi:hypothetical protein
MIPALVPTLPIAGAGVVDVPIDMPGLWWPAPPAINFAPGFNSAFVIDATGEKIAFMGRVWNKDRVTKNITKVGFRFGAVTKAGGSALTVSLQDVSLTSGPPTQPDEVQDQTVAIANADAAFISNTWYQTAALSSTRTATFGELLAVVIEYDGAGRLGADSVVISTINTSGAIRTAFDGTPSLKTGGTWATQASSACAVILEFDDGTFGCLNPGNAVGQVFVASAAATVSFNSGSTPDEYALRFTVPKNCSCNGAYVGLTGGTAAADFSVVLYEGTTALATVDFDGNAATAIFSGQVAFALWPDVSLIAGTEYFLALKPTTANSIIEYEFSVNDANHFQAFPGGTELYHALRTDAGAWTKTTTKRMLAGISISQI